MKIFTQHDPLTDAELDRLGDFFKSCKGGKAMNVEALDGFFAALIAGPETVMPSEYYPEVLRRRDIGMECGLNNAFEKRRCEGSIPVFYIVRVKPPGRR